MSLARALQFLACAAVGAGLTAVAMLPSTTTTVPAASPDDGTTPNAELQQLRAELAALRAGRASEPREPAATASPSMASPVDATTTSRENVALLQRLLGELDEQRRTGALADYYAGRTTELAEVVLRVYVETGAPDRAFQLLQAVDADLADLDTMYRLYVAEALRDRKSPDAFAAYLLVLDHERLNRDALDELARLDPLGTLTTVELRLQAKDVDDDTREELQLERIRLLFAAGRTKDALAAVQALAGTEHLAGDLLEKWIALAPAAASEHLRQRLAGPLEDDHRFALRLQLASALERAGDKSAARAEIDALLAADPQDESALLALARIAPAEAESRFRQQHATDQAANANLRLARGLRAAGKVQEAEELELQSFAAAPDDEDRHDAILAHASSSLVERMLSHARALPTPPVKFDELLGNMADALWSAGQPARALALWREALGIEPGDSEWIRKVKACEAGRDPMQDQTEDWWRQQNEW